MSKAVDWYQEAAEQSHANAQSNLNLIHETGHNIEQIAAITDFDSDANIGNEVNTSTDNTVVSTANNIYIEKDNTTNQDYKIFISYRRTDGAQDFKNIHSDAQYLSNPQFKIFKKSSGLWAIEHISSATNETIVNGKKLDGCIEIVDGMTVAVGNSAKGIHKLPLTLKLT